MNGCLLRVGLQENRVVGFLVLTRLALVHSGGDLPLPGKNAQSGMTNMGPECVVARM